MTKMTTACIIDDDDIFRFIMKKQLMNQNLADEIFTFENGEEAIEFLEENRSDEFQIPDVIFLDINMPIMDGWDFVSRFDKLKPDLPKSVVIYMISSSVDDRDIVRAKNTDLIKEYVIKPLDKEKITQLMQGTYQLT